MKKLYVYVLASLLVITGMSMHGYVCAGESSLVNFSKNIWFSGLEKLNLLSPERFIERAEKRVSDMSTDDLIADIKVDVQAGVRVYKRFGKSKWILVDIRNELDRFAGILKIMQARLINAKKKIAANKTKQAGYDVRCDALIKKVTDLTAVIDQRKAALVSNAGFGQQVKDYEKQQVIDKQNRIGQVIGACILGYLALGLCVGFYRFYRLYNGGGSFFSDSEKKEKCRNILGVSAGATDKDLQKALRKQTLEWHPDRCEKLGKKKEECATKMVEINGCYELLKK